MDTRQPGDGRNDAANALTGTTVSDDELCALLVTATGVSGAVISTLGRPLGSETVCASTAVAARLDEIQIDLGEGPSWEALRTRRPVLEPDLQHSDNSGWPGAREAFHALDVGAMYAFPLIVGDLNVGAVDLYSQAPRHLSQHDVHDITTFAAIVARHVLRRALDGLGGVDEGTSAGPYSRREVHQASGMVAAQLAIRVDDALVVLRGHAFASDRTVRQVAGDVVQRRLNFTP